MLNYEAEVFCDAVLLARPLCIVARGMGALAAMMAARRLEPERLALIEPWAPAEAGGVAEPTIANARPESTLAVDECRRGISIPLLPVRALVVGAPEVARFYGAEELGDLGKKTAAAVVQWAG
jgi:hypothetical protein